MPRKSDKMVLLGIALVAVVLVAVVGIFYYVSNLPSQQIIQQPTPTQYKLTLPTVFTVNDLWKGSTMSGVSIYIYKYSNKELLESGTVTNTYTSTNPLTSGDRYWVKLVANSAFKYYDITIPYESSPSASNHYVTLDFYTLDTTYPIKVFEPDGSSLTEGSTYDVSSAGNSYPSFTVMLGPPDDDTGIMNTYDPIKTLDRQVLIVINIANANTTYTSSNKLIVSNIPTLYSVSTTDRNFGFQIDPSKLVRDKKADGTYASEGIYSFTLSFDASGLSGNTEGASVTIYLYAFTNAEYFKAYGTHPTDYVSLGSFSFDISG
jgi:hypothetical protein